MLTAKDIMTTDVRSVSRDSSIEDLAKLFEETKYNALPVLDAEGRLEGVVSQNDLVERDKPLHIPTVISIFDWVLYLESEKSFMEDVQRMAARTVGEIMSPSRATCSLETTVSEIAERMSEKKAHLVPVVDDDGKVLGVVARLDIIRAMGK
jgi:CBS-domain-containing membrane protein